MNNPIRSDHDILGGTPVFVGTRVPVKTLYDYLEGGDSLDDFLADFPAVTHEQAVAALELGRHSAASPRGERESPRGSVVVFLRMCPQPPRSREDRVRERRIHFPFSR